MMTKKPLAVFRMPSKLPECDRRACKRTAEKLKKLECGIGGKAKNYGA